MLPQLVVRGVIPPSTNSILSNELYIIIINKLRFVNVIITVLLFLLFYNLVIAALLNSDTNTKTVS